MLVQPKKIVCLLPFAIGLICLVPRLAASPQSASQKVIDTTLGELITKSARFSGKRVQLTASFQSDGIERSVLLEPNCGLSATPKQTTSIEPQCQRGIVPRIPNEVEDHSDMQALDRVLGQGERGTRDKHVTAVFTGRFLCKPSCASPRRLILEIERVDHLEVVMRDLKPHRPTE
jgi:hypothetical protein